MKNKLNFHTIVFKWNLIFYRGEYFKAKEWLIAEKWTGSDNYESGNHWNCSQVDIQIKVTVASDSYPHMDILLLRKIIWN